jgi:hypothetical protein
MQYKQYANENENLFTRSTYGVARTTTQKLNVEQIGRCEV